MIKNYNNSSYVTIEVYSNLILFPYIKVTHNSDSKTSLFAVEKEYS